MSIICYYVFMGQDFTLHFDGSCGPTNPGGTAAYGFSLSCEGKVVADGSGVIGSGPGMTNNLAEFYALWQGLEAIRSFQTAKRLQVYGDSQLVIKMMNRKWKASPDKAYYPGYVKALESLKAVRRAGVTVYLDWVPRKHNQVCDDLSKAHQS